ncbi:MAG: hypothetical protein Q7R62_00920 [bacterium]|nr:hypothetical protein [bacterium]
MPSPNKFDLPDAIMIGGLAVFADFLSFIPFFGSLFLLIFWGIFKMMRLSAPFPIGSIFIKVVPLVSIVPLCTFYVWRVYQRNKPGGILSAVTSVVPNPAATVASLHLLPPLQEGSNEQEKQEKKAA